VTIIRPRHPFEGKLLELLRTMHRKGRLYLILILPDGTKSLIPADWTDFVVVTRPGQDLSARARATLGSIEDLLHTRAITDALLNRLAAITSEAEKESPLARKPSESLRLLLDKSYPWEALQAEQQLLAIDILARLIANATLPHVEEKDHE
jgi:hypothetical protein